MTNQPSPRIGWLGLGRMGSAFADRLEAAGHDLRVWNRTPAKAAPYRDRGVTVVDAVAGLADCDVVFVSVMADADLLDVVVGPSGLLSRADRVPGLIVDTSTVSTGASETVRAACAERSVAFLAAPVSGNAEAVAAGRASFVVSGPEDAATTALPLFECLGQSASYVGEGDGARIMKLCHNLFVGGVFQSLVEALVLAEKGGVSRSEFLRFINGSAMGSMFTRYKAPTLAALDYTPRFTTSGLLKDIDLGLGEATAFGVPMPTMALVRQLLQSAVAQGWGEDDFNRLLDVEARAANLELRPEDAALGNGFETSG